MATDRPGFASAFDALLQQNRQQLDDLMRAPAAPRPAPSPAAAGGPASSAPAARRRFGPLDPAASAAMQALDDRFGADGWRYEVAERRRVEDEMVVLCRLSLPGRNVVKAQFGAARLAGSGIAAEEAAVREAAEAALARCTNLL